MSGEDEGSGSADDPLQVQLSELEEGRELQTGQTWHLSVLCLRTVHLLEVEDVHFNHDSAVLLADYRDTAASDDDDAADAQDDDQDTRITALAIVAAAYRQVEEHPTQKLLIAGHTDRSGPDSYNLALSRKRAENVLHLLKGEKDAWATSSQGHHKVEDYQQLLKWLFEDHAWNTDPGVIDNVLGPETRGATRRFQETYNQEFSQSISEDGVVGPQTWGAFFDVYLKELREVMGISEAELTSKQGSLQFLDASQESVGCGENWPVTSDHRSRIDRRVELLFFDPGEEPTQTPLACHPSATRCSPDACELRALGCYTFTPLPVQPVLAPRFRVRVHMVFVWKDPLGIDHPFPVGFPVTFVFGDGSPSRVVEVGEHGELFTVVDNRTGSFTLRFEHPQASFIASKPALESGNPDNERLVTRAELGPLIRDEDWQAFLLPPTWSLDDTDWQVDTAVATTYAQPNFANLTTVRSIGEPSTPCRMELVPHWQYLQLRYYDRKLKQELSIPPVVLEGFHDRDAASGDPDAQSNWTTDPGACQCLPWLKRKAADGTALTKPDARTLLRLRSKANTFIDSSGAAAGDRKLITKDAGTPGDDPGENAGENTTLDPTQPNATRLTVYDLPALWLSRGYFCRVGTNAPDLWENVATQATTDAQPHRFSLDDLVLCDASLAPITLAATDRVALLSHLFAADPSDPKVSPSGVYDPDTNEPWFSKDALRLTAGRNVFAEHPGWTRCVFALGSVFDAFDRRTPDGANRIVGARAAVRWIDHTAAGNFVRIQQTNAAGAITANGFLTPRPPPRTHPQGHFLVVHPFYEQRSRRGTHVTPNREEGTGRFDLILLRCCDLAGGDTEVAVCIDYFRFFFNFNKPTHANHLNVGLNQANLTGAAARTYIQNCMRNIPLRWNGPDGTFNLGRPRIVPKSGTPKLRVDAIWFTQAFPNDQIVHFEMNVYTNGRAFMASDRGFGNLGPTDDRPLAVAGGFPAGAFTFAHENGHGAGLSDEYAENAMSASYRRLGFASNTPGAPFITDRPSMMANNMQAITPRYCWHIAEWLRFVLPGSTNMQIQHDYQAASGPVTVNFELPSVSAFGGTAQPANSGTPYAYTHVNWPLQERFVSSLGTRGRFDAILYALGEERFSRDVLNPAPPPARARIDGLLIVVVKMRFVMHTTNHLTILGILGGIDGAIRNAFVTNNRFVCTGTNGSQALGRCLIVFSPRYLVDTWSTGPGNANYQNALQLQLPPGATPAQISAAYTQRVNGIAANHPAHFNITTQAGGGNSWTATRNLTFDVSNTGQFARFFGEMVGMAPGTATTAAARLPIAQQVLTGATTPTPI